MLTENLLRRIDELLAQGGKVLSTRRSTQAPVGDDYVDSAPMAGLRSASLSFIERVYGESHPHFVEFKQRTNCARLGDAKRAIAILEAIRSEIAGGWLSTLKGLVAAELFSDFLEMAEHLLESGYKDAAAVMIGSVLEEHLRQLCLKHEIPLSDTNHGKPIPRKADRLNAELARAGVYTMLHQKQITAWLELRNNAAHGKYTAYAIDQVSQFRSGLVAFMARVAP